VGRFRSPCVEREDESAPRRDGQRCRFGGIVLQSFGYAVFVVERSMGPPGRHGFGRKFAPWRAMAFFSYSLSAALAFDSGRPFPRLGSKWRLEAGVNVDHELIQAGPLRVFCAIQYMHPWLAQTFWRRPPVIATVAPRFLLGADSVPRGHRDTRFVRKTGCLRNGFGERFQHVPAAACGPMYRS